MKDLLYLYWIDPDSGDEILEISGPDHVVASMMNGCDLMRYVVYPTLCPLDRVPDWARIYCLYQIAEGADPGVDNWLYQGNAQALGYYLHTLDIGGWKIGSPAMDAYFVRDCTALHAEKQALADPEKDCPATPASEWYAKHAAHLAPFAPRVFILPPAPLEDLRNTLQLEKLLLTNLQEWERTRDTRLQNMRILAGSLADVITAAGWQPPATPGFSYHA